MAGINEQIPSIEIHQAKPEDLETISKLVALAYQTPINPGSFTNRAEDSVEKLAQEIAEGTIILIARKGDEVIGTVRYKPENGFLMLSRLATAPEFRNQGVGNSLVKKVIDTAKSAKIPAIRLEVMEEKEKDLVPYYEALGFHETERIQYTHHKIITMEKKLEPTE